LPDASVPEPTSRNNTVASASGFLTGVAAGFIGVGGGEFRIPVLVQILRFPLNVAGGVNLVVGLFTVALGVARRWGQQPLSSDALILVTIMGVASLAGAAVGVAGRNRLPVRPLKTVVCAYLIVVGVWMLYESITHAEHVLLDPSGVARWVLATVIAFAIAVVSGVLGIAGGEMRIPALLYLFGLPVVEAGTLSLAVSVPTVAAGALVDRRLGGIPDSVVRIALVMGIASAVGVLFGAALLPYANTSMIKGALGVILLLATVRMTVGTAH
jgi:uncharacterized membrane protein YfcA